jgi:hypothetical protein
MRLIAYSFPIWNANQPLLVKGEDAGAWLAVHWREVLARFELPDSCLVGITTDEASSNYSMTCELQTTLEASGIKWPALRNHIPCMARII